MVPNVISAAAAGLVKSPVVKLILSIAAVGTGMAGLFVAYSAWQTSKLTRLDIQLRELEIEKAKQELGQ